MVNNVNMYSQIVETFGF